MSKIALSFNARNSRFSQYNAFDFDCLAVINGIVVGGNQSGLFTMSGNTDNGADIQSIVRLFSTDTNVAWQKRIRAFVISGEFEGDLTVTPIVDDDEAEQHTINAEESYYQRSYKIPVNADHKGMYVSVKVENNNSSNFSLETVDILMQQLPHKNG